jgi:hypothetical protein
MDRFGFTTNIAFIPWNWRRTRSSAAQFFEFESGRFSVSVHGCDHTAGEFAAISPEVLQSRARLAQSRMKSHALRTGIKHDSVMVFPQGAFSSACPEILKREGFLAAVNTEILPMDRQNARTRIRDVWDIAIMAYGGFPIFTRRYALHGLENFAFDLLLGKPCLIVAHHDFFKKDNAALIDLMEKIGSLRCQLRWRPLGEVLRMACRWRSPKPGEVEVEMFGSELQFSNSSDRAIELRVRKMKSEGDQICDVLCDDAPVAWTVEEEQFVFSGTIEPHGEKHFRVIYREPSQAAEEKRSLRYELAVGVRRMLSEFRDDYLSQNQMLAGPARKFHQAWKKAV